jgi:hypothetical protein
MKMRKQTDQSFDKTEVYEEQVKPLFAKLRKTCREYHLPMLAVVVFRCEDKENEVDCHFACTGGVGKDGWVPEELALASSLIEGKTKILLPLALSVVSSGKAPTKHGKN